MSVGFTRIEFDEDDIGPYLLESVTKGLYVDPRHCVREYVQNAVEANPPATVVKINIQGKNVFVWDDGGGMNDEELETAKKVGFSTKNPRDYFGFRGLGIYSGVSYCDEILISTKRIREDNRHFLRIDAKGIRCAIEKGYKEPLTELLTTYVSKASEAADKDEHGTLVQMKRVLPEFAQKFSIDSLKEYMQQTLPVEFDPQFPFRDQVNREIGRQVHDHRVYSVYLKDEQVFRPPFAQDFDPPKFGTVRRGKEILAFWWYCLHSEARAIQDQSSSGIVYKKKGFTVGDRQTCLSWWRKVPHLLNWVAGEIVVSCPTIIPNSERSDFESSPEKDFLIRELLDGLHNDVEDEVRKKSYLENAKQRIEWIDRAPRVLEFYSQDQKMEAISEMAGAMKALNKAYKSKYFSYLPASLRDRFPKLRKKAKTMVNVYTNTKVLAQPKIIKRKERKTPAIQLEQISPSTSLTVGLSNVPLSQAQKRILELLDGVLDEYLGDDTRLCYDLKRKIIDKIKDEFG